MRRDLVEAIKYSPLSRVASLPMRAHAALPQLARNTVHTLRWLVGAREWANFDYDYDALGVLACAGAIGTMTGVGSRMVRGFASELMADDAFAERCRQRVTSTRLRHVTDRRLHFGHPLFFYLIVRAIRPRVVFEAGTDKGLGSLAICRALARNRREGHPGRLITIDIASDRGDFLEGDEGGLVTRLTGDSVAALQTIDAPIDFFIHETLNHPDHTRAQFAALKSCLAPGALLHTAWFNTEFVEFCESLDFDCLEVVERPLNHWYPGRRMGLARARVAA